MSHSLVTPWTVGRQAPLSMGYSKEEFEAGLPFPPPGDLPDPETESASPAAPISQADPFLLSHQGSPISGLREVRSSLQSIVTSPEKRGIWSVPARHCGRCFTVTTTCQQSFQTGLVKLPSQLKSTRRSQRV